MTAAHVIFRKPKRKPKLKGIRILAGPLFPVARIKNECSSPLTAQSRARADVARLQGVLEDMGRMLLCMCGASVGARETPMGDYLVPTRHPVYRESRPPARKRDYGKRM